MSETPHEKLIAALLAHQAGLLTSQELSQIVTQWASQPTSDLDEILRQVAQIDAGTVELLKQIAEGQLKQHQGSVADTIGTIYQQTAAKAVSALPPQLQATLRKTVGDDLWATLVQSRSSASTKSLEDTQRVAGRVDRYSKLRPHAQGGLGQVFLALDEELNRHVALKQIQDRFAVDPDARQRFILEAEITGGLEHPGIVPVYGLGVQADGQPYYAMRFVRGESMADAISALHNKQSDLSQRMFSVRKLLGRMVDVCQAIAYAHSRGVVHRDIKPDNIMLGTFGETLVVDWGLAKLTDPPSGQTTNELGDLTSGLQLPTTKDSALTDDVSSPAGNDCLEDIEQPLRPSSASAEMTYQGSVKGTPAYMSPEQAAGNTDQIDQRSDIYSLGATLYAVLVGRPAIITHESGLQLTLDEVLQRIRDHRFSPPREAAAWIPKPLAAICERAMAARPEDRYATPLQLSDDLERWLADEPVSAYRESPTERMRRWIKRHQTLAASAAMIVLASLVGLTGFSILLRDKNQRLAELAESLRLTNENLQVAQDKAREEAAVALAVSKFLNDDLLSQASPRAHPNPRLEVRTVLERASQTIDKQFQKQPIVKAELLKTVGIAFRHLGEYPKARQALGQAVALFEQNFRENAESTLQSRSNLGAAAAEAGDFAEAQQLLDSAWKQLVDLVGKKHPRTLETQTELARLYTAMGRYDDAQKLLQDVIAAYRESLGANHIDTLECETFLVDLWNRASKYDESIALARDLRDRTLQALGPDHLVSLQSQLALAQRLYYTEQYAESQELYDDLIPRGSRLLGDRHPGVLAARSDRALLESVRGNSVQALQQLQELTEISKSVHGADHRDVLVSQYHTGGILSGLGRHEEAKILLEQTLQQATKSLGPNHIDTHNARLYLAQTLQQLGQLDQTKRLLREVIDSDVQADLRANDSIFGARVLLAELYNQQGQYALAIESAQTALDGYASRSSEQGLTFRVRANNAVLWSLVKLGRIQEAESQMQRIEQSKATDSDIAWSQLTLSGAYRNEDQQAEADSWLQKLIAWAKSLPKPNAEQADVIRGLAGTLAEMERYQESIPLLQHALAGQVEELGAHNARSLSTLGDLASAYYLSGDFPEAEKAYVQLAEGQLEVYGPNSSQIAATLDLLTDVMFDLDKQDQAVPWLEKLRQARAALNAPAEELAEIDTYLADSYLSGGNYLQAIARLRSLVDSMAISEGQEDEDQIYRLHQLAWCLSQDGQLQESVEIYRRVVRQRTRLFGAVHPYTLRSFGNLVENAVRRIGQSNDESLERVARADLDSLAERLEGLPSDEEEVADVADALGQAYHGLADYSQAARWLKVAVEGKQKNLGSEHASTLEAMHQLAVSLEAEGESDQAVQLLTSVVASRERVLGESNDATFASINSLAKARSLKEPEEALAIFEKLLRRIDQAKGENSFSALPTLVGIGILQHQQQQYPAAILHYRKCLEIAYRGLAIDSNAAGNATAQTSVGVLLIALADAELGDRRIADAALHVKEGLALIDKFAPGNWSRWRAASVQGGVYLAQSDHDSALPLLKQAYGKLSQPLRGLTEPVRLGLLRENVDRLIAASEAANLPEEAAQWRSQQKQPK